MLTGVADEEAMAFLSLDVLDVEDQLRPIVNLRILCRRLFGVDNFTPQITGGESRFPFELTTLSKKLGLVNFWLPRR